MKLIDNGHGTISIYGPAGKLLNRFTGTISLSDTRAEVVTVTGDGKETAFNFPLSWCIVCWHKEKTV